jgi:hypothetical protein
MTMTKHEQMEQFMKEMKAWKEKELEGLTGDDLFLKQITVDLEINDKWKAKRTELYSKTTEEIRAEYLGQKTHVFGMRRRSEAKRVIREDEKGFYILSQGIKARVQYSPVYRSMEVLHWEDK